MATLEQASAVDNDQVALLQRATCQVPGRTLVKRSLVLITALLAITVGATAFNSGPWDTGTTSTTATLPAISDAAAVHDAHPPATIW